MVRREFKIGLAALFFAASAGGGVAASMLFVREQPANVSFLTGYTPGKAVNLTFETVGELGSKYSQPDWVSYLVKSQSGNWVHSTQWELPAHTKINVTAYEYDTGSPLRNEVWGGIRGVLGNRAYVQPNGATSARAVSTVDSYAGQGVGHTFTVPSLGINVPLYGVADDAKHFCEAAPCHTSSAHTTVHFSFVTPGPGQYRWQCFIPCGAGFLDGNGGPMDTLGYMAGFLKVIAR